MTKKQKMYEKIIAHGKNVSDFFELGYTQIDDYMKLSKKLFALERRAHTATTNLCNTNNLQGIPPHYNYYRQWVQIEDNEETIDAFFDNIRYKLAKVIGKVNAEKCFINHDPRGYALKIKSEHTRGFYSRDFGGYGILAPDFSIDN